MSHMRLWVAATIIALALILGFVLSVPHTRDVTDNEVPFAAATSAPAVTLRDVFKKGVHTITGSLMAPDACAVVSAVAALEGEATSSESIIVAITVEEDSNVCLELPTRSAFEATVAAPARLPLRATVNGETATTTVL